MQTKTQPVYTGWCTYETVTKKIRGSHTTSPSCRAVVPLETKQQSLCGHWTEARALNMMPLQIIRQQICKSNQTKPIHSGLLFSSKHTWLMEPAVHKRQPFLLDAPLHAAQKVPESLQEHIMSAHYPWSPANAALGEYNDYLTAPNVQAPC